MSDQRNNQIYAGDCVVFMQHMEAESINLTVTSPPYDDLMPEAINRGNYS